MSVTVAKSAGFCFGVNRAVEMVYAELNKGKSVVTLGELIHNTQFVEELAQKGGKVVKSVEECTKDMTVVIRSHGVPPTVYDQLEKGEIPFVDATCPFVKKIHQIVENIAGEDSLLLIAGDKDHPEIVGIMGYAHVPTVTFLDEEEMLAALSNIENLQTKECFLVGQTTFHTQKWDKCVKSAKKVCTNLKIFDTICNATTKRQKEAGELASVSDIMLVVGGKHSSNTAKLGEICRQYCPTILVETAQELSEHDLTGYGKIGVTAGASTPACIIKEVQRNMSEIVKNPDEMSFEEMLEQSFKSTYTGEKVTGVVTGVKPNEVSVDIGTKHAGYIPLHELTSDPNAVPSDLVKVGDELELIVIRVNDVEGTMMLSKKRLDAIAGFEKVMAAVDTEEILEGVVTDVVKGGVLAITNGVKIFIPASQATASKNDSLESLLKKKVTFRILEVNRQRRRAVGSIRAVLRDQRKELEEKFWADVEVGKVYQGVVKSLTSYGAFVDLGGVDGMVHVSELSWSRIKHPSDVIKEGDVLEVYVKDIDPEKKKISLGYKKTEDNPWEILKTKHKVGDVVTAKIVSMTTFGAFAQIMPEIDGLIHISQIANERINKPQDVLSVGQEVQVMITEIDFDKKRLSLSMKALLQEEAPAEEAAPVEE